MAWHGMAALALRTPYTYIMVVVVVVVEVVEVVEVVLQRRRIASHVVVDATNSFRTRLPPAGSVKLQHALPCLRRTNTYICTEYTHYLLPLLHTVLRTPYRTHIHTLIHHLLYTDTVLHVRSPFDGQGPPRFEIDHLNHLSTMESEEADPCSDPKQRPFSPFVFQTLLMTENRRSTGQSVLAFPDPLLRLYPHRDLDPVTRSLA